MTSRSGLITKGGTTRTLPADQLAFLQHVYDKFKAEGGWPQVRQLQIELVDMGSIQAVADTIGSEYVRCDPPGDSTVCSLQLKGVAVSDGSQSDIGNFLATIRYAADRYVETKSLPNISGAILESALGMTKLEAKRACLLLLSAHGLWSGSRPIDNDVEITVGDDIVHYQGVQSLEEFWDRAERLKQQIMETGRRSLSSRLAKKQPRDREKGTPNQRRTVPYILLEKAQEELLLRLVEIRKRLSPKDRHEFWARQVANRSQAVLVHPALRKNEDDTVYMGDLEVLDAEGLITLTRADRTTHRFDFTPTGLQYTNQLARGAGQPIERTEAIPRRYIDNDTFKNAHPEAYTKWAQAEDELWGEDRETRLTSVGHLCREAMQAFATSLVKMRNINDVQNNPANTVARLRAALETSSVAETDRAFLDALVVYWGTVSDLVQRLEHGAQRERTPLQWKDASRLVFQTLSVMYEVDQSLRLD